MGSKDDSSALSVKSMAGKKALIRTGGAVVDVSGVSRVIATGIRVLVQHYVKPPLLERDLSGVDYLTSHDDD
jgi:hypothetical protein